MEKLSGLVGRRVGKRIKKEGRFVLFSCTQLRESTVPNSSALSDFTSVRIGKECSPQCLDHLLSVSFFVEAIY